MPLPRLRPGLGRAGCHRRRGRAVGGVGQGPGPCAAGRDRDAAGPHPRAADRQRRYGRSDPGVRPHGQAATVGRMASRARALGAGARGRPPLRPRHGGRRLRDVCRRDGSAGGGRRPGPRPRAHRGERGERQPGPGGAHREPQGTHRHAASRHLPRLGRAQLRPLVADLVAAGQRRRDGAGRRTDRGHPQRAGRRRGPVLVPHTAPHPVADRGRGDRPHPPARIAGGGDTRCAAGQPRHHGGRVPRQRRARRRRSASPHARPGRPARRRAHGGPPSR